MPLLPDNHLGHAGFDGSHHDDVIAGWLSTDLDAWTRRVLARHFDPDTGSRFWLKRAAELGFDPLTIETYDELARFGPFDLDVLRRQDPRDMVPPGRDPIVGRVWDSGGTTGAPCRVFYTAAMHEYRGVWRRWSWLAEGFRPGRTWLNAVPAGPHLVGHGAAELVEYFDAFVFGIDMDPRWVKHLIRTGPRMRELAEYTEHLVTQIADVLEHQDVHYLNSTPALFHALLRRRPDLAGNLDGVRMSGTQITADMRRDIVAALGTGICGISYGNTLGNSAHLPLAGDDETMVYAPTYPQITSRVVDRDDWTRVVDHGRTGRVLMTVLQDDLFLPNVLERDQAVRYDLAGRWPTDGVADVAPLQVTTSAPEGLY